MAAKTDAQIERTQGNATPHVDVTASGMQQLKQSQQKQISGGYETKTTHNGMGAQWDCHTDMVKRHGIKMRYRKTASDV